MRSNLEKDLKAICEGRRTKEQVLTDQITVYQRAFERADDDVVMLKNSLRYYMERGGRNPKFVPSNNDNFDDFDGRPPGGGDGSGNSGGGGNDGHGGTGGSGGNDGSGGHGGSGGNSNNFGGNSAADSKNFPSDLGNITNKLPGNFRKCSECLSPSILAKFTGCFIIFGSLCVEKIYGSKTVSVEESIIFELPGCAPIVSAIIYPVR